MKYFRRRGFANFRTISVVGLSVAILSAASGRAQSWQLGPFVRPASGNPVITPDKTALFDDPILQAPVAWEALHTFNPAAIVRDGKVYVLYRAEDDSGTMQIGMHTSRLGLGVSEDGVHFLRLRRPVFFPADDDQKSREWPGGVEDPRIVEAPDGTYVLTYTQWNRQTYSVGIATSKDLLTWKKCGPAFGSDGKYANLMYKSAAILTRPEHGRLIAAKIRGIYWMYWGEIHIHLATSTDLIHWTPVETLVPGGRGDPIELLSARPGYFDSSFPETGPPPLLTEKGIVLIYNGKNAEENGDPALGPNAYAAGQALFAADDPTKLISREDKPFFYPEMSYEKTGQYAAGTTFSEGLVWFKKKWFLYYGCADSLVGVAISDPKGK
jgi:beta-1,2-mannosidase